ncbi:MAG: phosphate transporter ATP-binding protein PhoT family [Bacteriovoracaceae bacterium]|nr:phosphate transporter ATP-binding protein PhoT family [Bacteriovoracaceae bacterium]
MLPVTNVFPKLLTDKLTVKYGEKVGVENISIKFFDSKVTALIGPSGCGKSTYLRSLNRMNDFIPNVKITGKVLFSGQDIYDSSIDPALLRRHIGMVFQKPNPFPKTIFENIAWGPKRAKFAKTEIPQLIEDSLRQAALWDEVKDRLHTSALGLSGGQQQRLCIARAIAMRPSVLLMDEPCSALDPIATSRIEDLIQTLKEKYTIVIVTHNMQQAARVSDITAFFLNGKLVESGETKQIFTLPKEIETENYLTGKFG